MSVPTEYDFAVLEIGDGEASEVFVVSCGKQDFTVNFAAQTQDRFVRDCAKPGEIPFRKTKASGKMLDITASGLVDDDAVRNEADLIGTVQNVRLRYYREDGTDLGELLATISCPMRINTLSIGTPREGDSTAEMSLASHGEWTFVTAP